MCVTGGVDLRWEMGDGEMGRVGEVGEWENGEMG
jgi:hypothetical protein